MFFSYFHEVAIKDHEVVYKSHGILFPLRCRNLAFHFASKEVSACLRMSCRLTFYMYSSTGQAVSWRSLLFLYSRINDLTAENEQLQVEVAEKDVQLRNFGQPSRAELSRTEASQEDMEPETLQGMREECESLHAALRDIAQAVIQDAEGSVTESHLPLEEMGTETSFASPFAKSTPLR